MSLRLGQGDSPNGALCVADNLGLCAGCISAISSIRISEAFIMVPATRKLSIRRLSLVLLVAYA